LTSRMRKASHVPWRWVFKLNHVLFAFFFEAVRAGRVRLLRRHIRTSEQRRYWHSRTNGVDVCQYVHGRDERKFSRPCSRYKGPKAMCFAPLVAADTLAQAFFPLLVQAASRNRCPRVVNIASLAGIIGAPNMSACVTKLLELSQLCCHHTL
jgi:hypothetical protein